jgi:hypothetical protein
MLACPLNSSATAWGARSEHQSGELGLADQRGCVASATCFQNDVQAVAASEGSWWRLGTGQCGILVDRIRKDYFAGCATEALDHTRKPGFVRGRPIGADDIEEASTSHELLLRSLRQSRA